MAEQRMSLSEFREKLTGLMGDSKLRPFVCDGNPLVCKVFVVGFNPATEMEKPFWNYWDDSVGFNKTEFMKDYLKKRKFQGVRPRIERIVANLPRNTCLETNICSKPTKRAADLTSNDRKTEIFRLLLEVIRPTFVYVHSNEPINFLRRLTGCDNFTSGIPRLANYTDQTFHLFGTSGPLFSMSLEEAASIAGIIRKHLVLPAK